MENNEINSVFINDEEIYNKKVVPIQPEGKNADTAISNVLYDNIVGTAIGSSNAIDINAINSLSQSANSRNEIYNIYDTMCEDGQINAVIKTYAQDSTEKNEDGNIVWATSSAPEIAYLINYYIDRLNINKNIYKWAYSLCKYGDVYIRLYRESEYEDALFTQPKKKQLNEDVKIKAFKKEDNYAHYIEMVTNPAEMFELTKFGKTVGYIETPVEGVLVKSTQDLDFLTYAYKFKKEDILIYPPTEFVHACIDNDVSRYEETVNIFLNNTDYDNNTNAYFYSVKKGQSLLANVYKIWRELQLLEASVLLNRVTKSSIVRIFNVEVGDMAKEDIPITLNRIKQLIEQKTAINKNTGMTEYTNPGPIENNIYVPSHNQVGTISTQQIGGDVDVKSLADLDWYLNKLFSGLQVPKQYFCLRGDTPILLLDGQTKTIKYLYEHCNDYIGKGILSCSQSGKITPTKIKNILLTRKNANFIRIHLDNGKFVDVTPDHRIMLRDGTFKEAQDLKVNDSLMPYYDKLINGRRSILDNESGKWKLQYRVVAEHKYKDAELQNKQVHHIDHSKINDDFNNLIPLTGTEHILEHHNELHKANLIKNREKRKQGIDHGNKGKFSVTNGIENKWLDKYSDIPEGFWLGQTCNYTDEGRQKISQTLSKANKGRQPWCKGLTKETSTSIYKLTTKMMQTRAQKSKQGCYDSMYKKQSEFCKKTESWKHMHRGHMATIPENRKKKERYVRCVNCKQVHKIRCNDDWYTEYLNLDRLWYCSKTCRKIDGNGKLCRSYKLYNCCNKDIDLYAQARYSKQAQRPDMYFLPESLKDRLELIDNYVPSCNHKVTKLEWLKVSEPAYDIEVESENHTFALPCGIFVHNCQTDDSAGFNGGQSLTIISSRYAKTVKYIQSVLMQLVTDILNLILLDKGLDSYINNFEVHLLPPVTQEDVDRVESQSTKVQLTSDIMNMLSDVEDPIARLKILKNLLSKIVNDDEIISEIQAQIEQAEEEINKQETEEAAEITSDLDTDEDVINISELETDTEEPEQEEDVILPTPEQLGVDMLNAETEEQ